MNPLPPRPKADSDFNARVIEILAAAAILVVLIALALRAYPPLYLGGRGAERPPSEVE